MSENLQFVDNFWETDFNGTRGFDLLCKRIKEGQKTCKDVEEFFRKKSKAQLQYSKALKTLVRPAEGREDIGGLGKSWAGLKTQTEKTARFYETSARDYNKLADDLAKFNDNGKLVTKQVEDRVKERQKIKKTNFNRVTDLKNAYAEKCRDFKLLENQYDSANSIVTSNPKEKEKIKLKFDKSREAMEKSDTQYKQSVELLEQARMTWESEMEEACEIYQRNEEDRIYNIRDFLWKATNIDSRLCVEWDQSCETVRLDLEKCDIGNDLNGFITTNSTGMARPVAVTYECYFSDKPSDKGQSKTVRNQPLPPLPVAHNST